MEMACFFTPVDLFRQLKNVHNILIAFHNSNNAQAKKAFG